MVENLFIACVMLIVMLGLIISGHKIVKPYETKVKCDLKCSECEHLTKCEV